MFFGLIVNSADKLSSIPDTIAAKKFRVSFDLLFDSCEVNLFGKGAAGWIR
jgi:hypothetical protein